MKSPIFAVVFWLVLAVPGAQLFAATAKSSCLSAVRAGVKRDYKKAAVDTVVAVNSKQAFEDMIANNTGLTTEQLHQADQLTGARQNEFFEVAGRVSGDYIDLIVVDGRGCQRVASYKIYEE